MARLALLLVLLVSVVSPAAAEIKVCNNFKQTVHFALAYQKDDKWTTQGWLNVKPKQCGSEPTGLVDGDFYYYAKTDPIKVAKNKRQWWSWGSDDQFSIRDGNFVFKNADKKQKGARLVPFHHMNVTFNDATANVTITFLPDAKTTSTFSTPPGRNAPDTAGAPTAPREPTGDAPSGAVQQGGAE